MILNGRELKPYKITQTPEEVAGITGKEPKVLITDFDDTLALIVPKQLKMILESKNIEEYRKYMNIRPMSNRFLYDRTKYYTCDWLKRNDVDEVPKHIVEEVTDFFNHPDFYKDIPFTKFAYSLRQYVDQDYCEKIYIVSHCLTETSVNAKIDSAAEFFKDCAHPEKIEFIPTTDTRKSIPIMDMGIKWDIFADDRLECIYDMVLYGQGFGNEILIPSYGYNKPDERFTKLVDNYNLQTFYMDVI